ncbi:MAG: HD-GYP domain-containing protein [Acidobacteriota bacterium]
MLPPRGALGEQDPALTMAAKSAAADDVAAQDLSSDQIYAASSKVVRRLFVAAASLTDESQGARLPIEELVEASHRILRKIDAGNGLIAKAVGSYPDTKHFILPHSVNVAILSQRIARQLELEPRELETLCLAALAHDVGTVRIPDRIFNKPDSLSGDEWEVMRQRPRHSYDILCTLGPDYRSVAEIAYQVHERLDGSGYPRQLKVDEIAIEASIIGAVDIFEAFIHPRPYKKTVPAAAMYGVDNLMRMSHQFGDSVLKALVRSIGLFPVGTYVKLNSGEVAQVFESKQHNPMRPTVDVLFDTQDRRIKRGKTIDLMQTPHLYVFRPLSAEDLRELGLLKEAREGSRR